ncbi:MAG: NAD(P)/FAD-dependent oxidoreductase [Bacteroidia bacterium]|nr:NAD(P)/FAD-dependent oxidoreductase [Bacteroidia bacterium]
MKEKKLVIIGAGFAGLNLARKLKNSGYEITLLDKNNYHQFQPLFYQVATAGLEPSAISFPLRKVFQGYKKFHIRTCEVIKIESEKNVIQTSIGEVDYDILVIATGADTNFFGMKQVEENAIPMKSVSEALYLRNHALQRFEDALSAKDETERKALLTFVVVGGGATGVEVSGALADLKRFVLPKDFPELNFDEMEILLIENGDSTLSAMSAEASAKSKEFLERLGVKVMLSTQMKEYDGRTVILGNGKTILARTMVWAAGIKGNVIDGLNQEIIVRGSRMKVDRYNKVIGYENIYAIGDIANMVTPLYEKGHPQLANVAINQGKTLAKNLKAMLSSKPLHEFEYKDMGSMATVGRNLAVADFKKMKFQGLFAWMLWMFIHLMLILGAKNKFFVFINWAWNYITFDQSLRLIIKPFKRKVSR